jgi:hypothetical protein
MARIYGIKPPIATIMLQLCSVLVPASSLPGFRTAHPCRERHRKHQGLHPPQRTRSHHPFYRDFADAYQKGHGFNSSAGNLPSKTVCHCEWSTIECDCAAIGSSKLVYTGRQTVIIPLTLRVAENHRLPAANSA